MGVEPSSTSSNYSRNHSQEGETEEDARLGAPPETEDAIVIPEEHLELLQDLLETPTTEEEA